MALYSTYISNIKNLTDEEQSKVLNIARFFRSDKFRKDIRLSPSNELLKMYKAGIIDWDEFETEFKIQMSGGLTLIALRELYKRLKSGEDIILVCYEKDYTYCHRRLIGEFMMQYDIEYHELKAA